MVLRTRDHLTSGEMWSQTDTDTQTNYDFNLMSHVWFKLFVLFRYPTLTDKLVAPAILQPLRFKALETGPEEDAAMEKLIRAATPGNEW